MPAQAERRTRRVLRLLGVQVVSAVAFAVLVVVAVGYSLLGVQAQRESLEREQTELSGVVGQLRALELDARARLKALLALEVSEPAARADAGGFAERFEDIVKGLEARDLGAGSGAMLERLHGAAEGLGRLERRALEWDRRHRVRQRRRDEGLALKAARTRLEAMDHAVHALGAPPAHRGHVFLDLERSIAKLSRQLEVLNGIEWQPQLEELRGGVLQSELLRVHRDLEQLPRRPVPPALSDANLRQLTEQIFGAGAHLDGRVVVEGEGGLVHMQQEWLAAKASRRGLEREVSRWTDDVGEAREAYVAFARARSTALTGASRGRLTSLIQATIALVSLGAMVMVVIALYIARNVRRQLRAVVQMKTEQQALLRSVGDGIIGLDPSGRTTFVNPAATQMLGYQPAELLGQLHHDLLHHSREDGAPLTWR